MTDTSASMDGLRKDLARLVHQLIDERPERRRERPVTPLVLAHLGDGARSLPVLQDTVPYYDLPNLHLALERLPGRQGWSVEILGVAGEDEGWHELSLPSLLMNDVWEAAPERFATADVGPGQTLACRVSCLMLITAPEGPLALLLTRHESGEGHVLSLEIVSPVEGAAAELLAWLHATIAEVDVFRGKVLTVEANPMRERATSRSWSVPT